MENPSVTYAIRFRHIFFALAVMLLAVAIITYSPADNAVLEGGSSGEISNAIGSYGAAIGRFAFYRFGIATYPVLLVLIAGAVRAVFPRKYPRRGFWPGLILFLLGCSLVFALNPSYFVGQTARLGLGRLSCPELALSGGAFGAWLAGPPSGDIPAGLLRGPIGVLGTLAVGWVLTLFGMILMIFADWRDVGEYVLARRAAAKAAHDDEPAAPAATATRRFTPRQTPPPEPEPALEPEPETEDSRPPRRGWLGLFRRREKMEAEEEVIGAEAPAATELPLSEAPAEEAPRPWRVQPTSEPLTSVLAERRQTPQPAPLATPIQPATAPQPAAASVNTANFTITVTPGAAPKSAAPAARPATPAASPTPAAAPGIPEMRMSSVQGDAAPALRRGQEYVIPPVSMLSIGNASAAEPDEVIERNKQILQDVLDSFQVDGQVTGHIPGPRVTRYEISLSPGVNVNQVSRLSENIKMSLCAKTIRILAPIPGHDAVGVEVPNSSPSAVYAREIMETAAWRKSEADIPIVLGKNVSGRPIVMDLARAPHLLVAGTTGSGKSVCMNTLIMSLLLHFELDGLRLILVDPKVVEYAAYQNLPQLITPVISDASKVPLALRWAVNEMEKRYRALAAEGVKSINEYNAKHQPGDPERLPVLVIIIDELADLMMTEFKGEVEICINRIAAKGRAAGIHIVVATQSPRRDVITGLIKANLPTRISFAVTSQLDSRVILDCNGAETLLGKGDMLLLGQGGGIERVQGAFVKDEDIRKVVDFISGQASQQFDASVVDTDDGGESGSDGDSAPSEGENRDFRRITRTSASPMVQKYLQPGDDDLVARALEVIFTDRKASTSSLQRRLKIGYNRAADLMDLFEDRGLIGPDQQGGRPRDVLVFDGLESGDY
ncbi:MAG: DNA translocase FtsK 4TM domain-containing protein [Victivallaceae bacterium]|nr:DNA translocase FtsK [Victivallaceae bacterium]